MIFKINFKILVLKAKIEPNINTLLVILKVCLVEFLKNAFSLKIGFEEKSGI